jgi:hypothetical protein
MGLRQVARAAIAVFFAVQAASIALTQTLADFYRGKAIDLYINSSVGGGYDLYARIIARHIGRHIPGNPTILPRNMEGGGGIRLANWLYNVGRRDGTAIGAVARAMAFEPLLGNKGGAVRRDQIQLYRQRQRRGQRLRRLVHVGRQDIRGCAEDAARRRLQWR